MLHDVPPSDLRRQVSLARITAAVHEGHTIVTQLRLLCHSQFLSLAGIPVHFPVPFLEPVDQVVGKDRADVDIFFLFRVDYSRAANILSLDASDGVRGLLLMRVLFNDRDHGLLKDATFDGLVGNRLCGRQTLSLLAGSKNILISRTGFLRVTVVGHSDVLEFFLKADLVVHDSVEKYALFPLYRAALLKLVFNQCEQL